MKAVVLGDIGWRTLYHLGDEAMTEVAIEMLRERGVDEVVVLAGEPSVANKFYGVPAVKRIGFLGKWGRSRDEAELARVTSLLATADTADETATFEAIRTADLVVIAGGGNMNSDHYHHLYERLAFTRIAKHYRVPLFVSSQTIGPMLRPVDQAMVAEIIEYATCFGTREGTSYAIARDLAADKAKIVQTYDDASLLQPNEASYERLKSLRSSKNPYAVASFTAHQGTTGMSGDEYEARVAALLDEIVDRFDLDVVLAPHAGSLDTSAETHDQVSNSRISEASRTGRVTALPMLTAREVVALTAQADLSISTRYHPAIFAPQTGTPTLAISLSYYSSIRMRGALSNVGLQRFVIPYTEWALVIEALDETLNNPEPLKKHLAAIPKCTRDYQNRWWDAIFDASSGDNWSSPGNLPTAHEHTPAEPWSERVEIVTPIFDMLGREKVYSKWFSQDRNSATRRAKELQTRVDEISSSVSKAAQDLLAIVK